MVVFSEKTWRGWVSWIIFAFPSVHGIGIAMNMDMRRLLRGRKKEYPHVSVWKLRKQQAFWPMVRMMCN
jgi:hypothetical protein